MSLITLVKRLLVGEDNIRYRASLYYLRKRENQIEVHFVITKDMEPHVALLQHKYTASGATIAANMLFEFESECISLELPHDGVTLESGWRIIPLTPPVITKQQVDSFSPRQALPTCHLIAEWTKESKPMRLTHKVTLVGAKEPFNYFRIVLDSDPTQPGLHSKYPLGLDSQPKLLDLMNEVATKIPGKWRDMGLQLGVDHGVLEGIATINPGDTHLCYTNVFSRWKNQNSTAHPHTWSTIVQALNSPVVGESRLADKIMSELSSHPFTTAGGVKGLHSKYPAGLDSQPELSDLVAIQSKWTDVGSQLGLDHGVGMRDHQQVLDVIGETSVLITSKAQTFHWEGYGLKLLVPPEALPPGMKQCELLIKVEISGQFTFPKNTSLVSAVYWLHSEPRCEFSQPLTLEIQHCATSSQTSRLTFAKCSDTSLPYNFDILEGRDFSEDGYGRIQLQSFSRIAVLKWLTWLFGLDDLKYHASIYHLWKGENRREIHFVVTKDLEAHDTKVRQEYTGRGATIGSHMKVEFEASSITLQLPHEDETLGGGWKLLSMIPPVILKEDVDSSGAMHKFPHCELTAMWTGQDKPSQLAHEVTLNGAKKPFNYFRIVLDSTPPDRDQPQEQNFQLHTVDDTPLEGRSLVTIVDTVHTLTAKWFNFGLALGLSYI